MMAKTAVSNLEERLKVNPRSLAYVRLAEHYRTSGQVDRAVETCARGVALHPGHSSGHLVLGRCFMDQGSWMNAVEELTAACRIDARNLNAIKLLGDICRQKGVQAKAGDLYRLLLKMDPFNTMLVALSSAIPGSGKSDLFEIMADVKAGLVGESTRSERAVSVVEDPVAELIDPAGPLGQETLSRSVNIPEEVAASDLTEIGIIEVGPGNGPAGNSVVTEAESAIPDVLMEETTRQLDLPDGAAISSRLETLFPKEPAAKPDSHLETAVESFPAQPLEIEMLEVTPLEAESGSNETLAISEFDGGSIDFQVIESETAERSGAAEKPAMVNPGPEAELITAGASTIEELVIQDPSDATAPEETEEDLFETLPADPVIEGGPAVRSDSAAAGGAEELSPVYILTPTLAEIYFMQGQLQRGLDIYRQLLLKDPGNALYRQRIGEIEKTISSGSEALPLSSPERGKAIRKAGAPSQPENGNQAKEPGSKG